MEINIPDNRRIRLIIDSDAENEVDDKFAIAHTLLSKKFIVKGIINLLYNVCKYYIIN